MVELDKLEATVMPMH